jgi:hypothetical protein
MDDEKNDDRRDDDGKNNDNNDDNDSNKVVHKLELSFCEFIDTQQLCYNNKGILIDFKTTIHTVKEAYSSIMDDVDDINQLDMKQLINQLIIFADNFSNEFESAYIVDSVVELICVLVKYDLIIISLDIIPIITVESIQNSINTFKSNKNSNKTNNPYISSSSSSSSVSFLASVASSSSSTTSAIDDDNYITIEATTDIHSSLRCRDWYSQLRRWAHHQKAFKNHNIASTVKTSNTRLNDIAVNTGTINTTSTNPTTSSATSSTTTTNTVSGGMMMKKENSTVKRNSVLVKVIIVVFVELSSRCTVSVCALVCLSVCLYIYIYIYVDVICL